MLEADPNLERGITICQGTEKMIIPDSRSYDKEASTIQTALDTFSLTKK